MPSNEVIKKAVADRLAEFAAPRLENNPRYGVGVALEVTVRLLAPELFQQVLAVVQDGFHS